MEMKKIFDLLTDDSIQIDNKKEKKNYKIKNSQMYLKCFCF